MGFNDVKCVCGSSKFEVSDVTIKLVESFIPRQHSYKTHVFHSYRCKRCKKELRRTPEYNESMGAICTKEQMEEIGLELCGSVKE